MSLVLVEARRSANPRDLLSLSVVWGFPGGPCRVRVPQNGCFAGLRISVALPSSEGMVHGHRGEK